MTHWVRLEVRHKNEVQAGPRATGIKAAASVSTAVQKFFQTRNKRRSSHAPIARQASCGEMLPFRKGGGEWLNLTVKERRKHTSMNMGRPI